MEYRLGGGVRIGTQMVECGSIALRSGPAKPGNSLGVFPCGFECAVDYELGGRIIVLSLLNDRIDQIRFEGAAEDFANDFFMAAQRGLELLHDSRPKRRMHTRQR